METEKPDSFTNQIFGLEGYLEVSLGPSDTKKLFTDFLSEFFTKNCLDWEIIEKRGYPDEEPSSWIVRFVGPTIEELYNSFPDPERVQSGVEILLSYLGTERRSRAAVENKIYLLIGYPEEGRIYKSHLWNSLSWHSTTWTSSGALGTQGPQGVPYVVKVGYQTGKNKSNKGKKNHSLKNQNHALVQHRKIHSNWSTRPRGRGR